MQVQLCYRRMRGHLLLDDSKQNLSGLVGREWVHRVPPELNVNARDFIHLSLCMYVYI